MRKILLIIMVFMLAFNVTAVTAQEAVVSLDAVSEALNLTVDYDEKTDSLFINGIDTEAVKGNGTTLYINGYNCGTSCVTKSDGKFYITEQILNEKLKTATAADGSFVKIEEAKAIVQISPDKTYAIINCQSGKALTAEGNNLYTAEFTKSEGQKFKILDSGTEGFYHIRTVETNRNLDVYNHWMDPGVKIIVWDVGTGDNQKFSIEAVEGGCYITARGRSLPIDEYEVGIVQNAVHGGDSQKWQIVEIE